MPRLRIAFVLSLASAALACSSEETGTSPPPDAAAAPGDAGSVRDGGGSTPDGATASDASAPDAAGDAGACEGPVKTGSGETCVGYGTGESCPAGCGQPYGYVCFDGPPPGFTGCRETRVSALLGNNYCCPQNDCVAQPDQNAMCNGVGGKPNRFQCPPQGDGGDGGNVAPPAGCVEHASGTTSLEKFYCCP